MKIKLKNMDKAKEINIVVAMKGEATALIKYWDLKPSNISKKIFLNKEKKINLLISGIGKNNAEEGTIFLAEKTKKNSFFLNIGIAGHRDFKLGEIFLVSKVTDNKTNYNWYPTMLWKTKIQKAPLITVRFPKLRYATNALYDMEASGFFKGARKYVGPEMVQSIKIISDNKKSSILHISSNKIENWVKKKTIIIDKLIKEFLTI